MIDLLKESAREMRIVQGKFAATATASLFGMLAMKRINLIKFKMRSNWV